ncbi:MAG: Ig-like domain-containing protein, partial [Verrucomicrobiota bacterium]
RFTSPLATNAVVGTNNFYAGFGGRRLLSRVELSSDRTKATLFYLEPLPGSTRVVAVFDGTALTDFLGRPLDADGDGQSGGSEVIAFDTLSLTPLTGTAVVGRVFASELMPGGDTGTNAVNRPLEGVTITVDGREQDLRTTTDAMGNFTLTPVPPGRFFVKIDGRTAKASVYPSGAYYPYVGKAWDAVAGRTNNLAGGTGDIFLPLITAGTLQSVSLTQDTPVALPSEVLASNPALAGVSITVPANSLFSDDGTRGGKVGIAPVPPDRLPGPLPPGLQPPIVITVQTDGPLNFDRPAPVCFPNLPDPVLGTPLPAGSQQELISFNHKKGIWEDVGSMTVSADGRFICTDPGVGILQPGWHGVAPKPDGPPPPEDPCGGGPKPKAALASYSPGLVRRGDLEAIGLHKGACLSCKPDEHARQLCFELCQFLAAICHDKNRRDHLKNKRICDKKGKESGTFAEVACSQEENDRYGRQDVECTQKTGSCLKACRQCWTSDSESVMGTSRSPTEARAFQATALGPESESLRELILGLIDQARAILAPYIEKGNAPAPEARAQADALYEQADRLAGGDAAAFLEIHAIELERQMSQLESQVGPPTQGPPSYPVRYVADILRPNGLLYLRGETAPFGQYSVFVPRDGRLLSVSFYDPHTEGFDQIQRNSRPEARYALDAFSLRPLSAEAIDSDHDGLPDVVEAVYGTDPGKADTDGDGIPDGAEVENGTNPLDGLPTQTGIIATARTPGPAVDVCVANDLVILAELDKGVSIFNIFNGMNPILVAQVPTPGNAQRVAVTGNFVAVAQPDFGLSIIDVSTPASARIVQHLGIAGAQAVVAGESTAYVGLDSGMIVAVDLVTGKLGDRISVINAVWDLALNGDYLYALTDDALVAISRAGGAFALAGSASSPFFAAPNRRLFVGGGIAYAIHNKGYNTFGLGDPSNPALIKSSNTAQFGWKQIVPNGSGLGLAAVGPNLIDDGPHDISLYDLSRPSNTDVFVTTFPTPGHADAVAIWNGLAYVADREAGLQVINYLAYDSKGVPPRMTVIPGFDPNGVQAGTHVSITANATDEVQVRNVEFYMDGAKVFSDGNFPFEYRFVIPALSAAKTSFTLRARAIDTGGNATWSDLITVKLLPDARPPAINFTTPVGGGARTLDTLQAYFSKPIDPRTLTSDSFQLFAAGPDGSMGTADDVSVTSGIVSYTSVGSTAALTFAAPLPVSRYRAVITTAVTDLAGNHLAANHAWDFQVADATFWVNFADGDWSNPRNWSTGKVPGPADNVIIATATAALITHSHGTDTIASLLTKNPFLLSGGTLEVNGTMQIENRFELSGGTLAHARLVVEGAAPSIRVDARAIPFPILDGVTLDADMTLTDDRYLNVMNGLTLNGTLTIAALSGAGLDFLGTQTLGGKGQVVFAEPGQYRLRPQSGTLTIGPGLTIRGGSGRIGGSSLGASSIINQGTIAADVAGQALTFFGDAFTNQGTVEVKNGAELTLGGSWTNIGVLRVNEGTLNLGGTFTTAGVGKFERTGGKVNIVGVLDNTGATLSLDAGTGSWMLVAGGTIRGGNVTTSGGAALQIAPVASTF